MKARLPLLAALAATAFAVAGMACGGGGVKLRDAAAADLNCPPKQVHIIGASKIKDVTACGQHATYKFEDGDWVMISREGAAPNAGAQVKAGPPGALPAQPAMTPTGTPSLPPSSPPPPAPGQKAL